MPWTRDQQAAIDLRGANLLLAAAAGSGKTSVLVARVMRLLDEGENIDEMLIVTFTRAASADMRNKLAEQLNARAARGDARAREQMERLECSSISTLHSFCTDVLRSHFEAADVDPQFRILDDAENRRLMDKALNNALESAYLNGGEDMEALDYARGPDRLRQLALSLYMFLDERPDPDDWMRNALDMCASEDGQPWTGVLARAAQLRLKQAQALNEYGITRAEMPGAPAGYADAMRMDAEFYASARNFGYSELNEMLGIFKQVTPARSGRKSIERDEELYNEVTGIRKRVKRLLDSAVKLVSLNIDESLEDIRSNARALNALWAIVTDMRLKLDELKSERAALTFSDLEHKTLKALADARVSETVRARYKHVFVDEYQDTSDVQEAILARVKRADNLFMVGDVKQSIYRFREAEPKLFMEKYARYKLGGDNKLIVLKQNFRSRPNVLAFVNRVFERVLTGGASEIVYDEDARLVPGAAFKGEDAPIEIYLIDKRNEDAGDAETDAETDAAEAEIEEMSDAEREGALIARRIRALRKEDPSLKYSDICVLTRVRVNAIEPLASALALEGIPVYADASESYFDALEVMLALSALRLIVNRRRDLDLLAVLRSPMVGLTSAELAMVRAGARGGDYLDAALAYAEGEDDIARALRAFFKRLDDWKALARALPIARMVRHVINDTDYYACAGALPGGAQRQANLDMLCARANAYEQIAGGSLTEFLEYAAELRARGDGDGAHILGENEDVVRLMTAHKSKGLEFKVVICALLGRKFRSSRKEDKLIAHRDLGAALMRVDDKLDTMRDTLSRRAIVEQCALEDRAEELRILYVMLTRAKERLILLGTARSLASARANMRMASKCPELCASFLDIVCAAISDLPGGAKLLGDAYTPSAADAPGAPRIYARAVRASAITFEREGGDQARNPGGEALARALSGDRADADDALEAALNWTYPHPERVGAPLKLTASGLTREIVGAEQAPAILARPQFLSESGLTRAERGTAAHAALRALELAPFRALRCDEWLPIIKRQLDGMRASGRLSPAQRAAVSERMIYDFLTSGAGARMLASPRVEREWRFNLVMDAAEALPALYAQNPPAQNAAEGADCVSPRVIVQGSIDLCFIERGEWVLLDYKTDRADDNQALINRYAPQLKLYAEALGRITGIPVKETLLCLIAQGDALAI